MNKNVKIILGGKWGDEGKGKVASYEAKNAKLVIRATGGANAGHTIVMDKSKLALHLIPGGIVYAQTTCLIGQGVVLDIPVLLNEIQALNLMGVYNVEGRLKISGRAHIVFPYHKDLDMLYEKEKKNPVGTTGGGIGPCYADKDNRIGIRVYDLLLPTEKLQAKIEEAVKMHNQLFRSKGMDNQVADAEKLAKEYHDYGILLKPMIVNADVLTRKAIDNGDKIVIEGAQGYRLDKDYGDYPNVTSSNCVTAGTLIGAHIPHSAVQEVIAIVKGYDTRVGNGPFPTEQSENTSWRYDIDEDIFIHDPKYVGDLIRERGHEYGATTGRPRRTGWFDAVLMRSAKYAMGIDCLCINHMDTLGKIGEELGYVRLCVAYLYQGMLVYDYPDDMEVTGEVPIPQYITFDGGWTIDKDVDCYDDLPKKLKEFVVAVEEHTGIPVKFIGIGPDNDDMIVRETTTPHYFNGTFILC